ncbi:MAG: response regulator transcription factor [Campylobacterales bacterium]|nr:response regulator transcription factor [Campylobacterales bacterium]
MKNDLTPLKNLRLLLVEDDTELLDSLKATLDIFFKEIIVGKNGIEGYHAYKKNKIDILITDYVMPEGDGYSLVSRLRDEGSKIPILIISNSSDGDKLLKCIPLELTNYLIKPISYDTLVESLSEIVNKLDIQNENIERLTPEIEYNFSRKELRNNDEIVILSKSEIKTLEVLLKNKNKVVPSEEISMSIDYDTHKSEQAIKNLIHRLRQKLGKNTITNRQGFGYILEVNF